jgi:hypothetical protein
MGKCKWCKRSGESLRVTRKGLCRTCEPGVTMEVKNRSRMINHCKKLMGNSSELEAHLSQCDHLVEHAEALLQYEERGIPTVRPAPSDLIREYRDGRDDLIVRWAEREAENALAAAEVLTSPDTKVSQLSKVLLRIQKYKMYLGSAGRLDALEKKVAEMAHQIQLTGYLEEARDADIRGLRKRAFDLYKYALHFLESEGVEESLREENLPAVEAKVAELTEPEEVEEEAEPEEDEEQEGEEEEEEEEEESETG